MFQVLKVSYMCFSVMELKIIYVTKMHMKSQVGGLLVHFANRHNTIFVDMIYHEMTKQKG